MITVNLYYKGSSGSARAFAEEMESSGIAADIRAEKGNLHYQYFQPLDDPETILLIDSWTDQDAIDVHHASPMMAHEQFFPRHILSPFPLIYALKFGNIIAEKPPVVHRQAAVSGEKHSQITDKGCTLFHRVDLNDQI